MLKNENITKDKISSWKNKICKKKSWKEWKKCDKDGGGGYTEWGGGVSLMW